MPTFNLQLEFDENGAVRAARSLDNVGNAAERAGRAGANAGNQMGDALSSAAKKVAALTAAYLSLEKAMSFIKRGIDLNSSLEQSQIGIATLITSMVKLENAQGKVLEGAEKYSAAQGIAAEMMKKIQILGLETTATTESLVEGVQSIMGPALQAGMALEKIPEFAVAGAQAMQTLGIPLEQMRTELEALLSGNVNKTQDILAPKLFSDVKGDLGEYIRGLKESGKLLGEIEKRLAPFNQAGKDVANTWSGLVSNLDEALDTLSGKISKGLLTDLKESVRLVNELFVNSSSKDVSIGDNFKNIADVLSDIGDKLGNIVLENVNAIVNKVKELNAYLGTADLTGILNNLTNVLKICTAAMLGFGSVKMAVFAKDKIASVMSLASAAIGRFTAVTNTATAATTMFGKAVLFARGVVAALGGPVTAAIGLAAAATVYLTTSQNDAKDSVELLTEAQQTYGRVLKEIEEQSGKTGKKLTESAKDELEEIIEKTDEAWRKTVQDMKDAVAVRCSPKTGQV